MFSQSTVPALLIAPPRLGSINNSGSSIITTSGTSSSFHQPLVWIGQLPNTTMSSQAILSAGNNHTSAVSDVGKSASLSELAAAAVRRGRLTLEGGLLWWYPEGNDESLSHGRRTQSPILFLLQSTEEAYRLLQEEIPSSPMQQDLGEIHPNTIVPSLLTKDDQNQLTTSTEELAIAAIALTADQQHQLQSLKRVSNLPDTIHRSLNDIRQRSSRNNYRRGKQESVPSKVNAEATIAADRASTQSPSADPDVSEINEDDIEKLDDIDGDGAEEGYDEIQGTTITRLLRVHNSLRILTRVMLGMLHHPLRNSTELVIHSDTIADSSKRNRRCWMIGTRVYDIVTIRQMNSLLRDLNEIFMLLGVSNKGNDPSIKGMSTVTAREWNTALDHGMEEIMRYAVGENIVDCMSTTKLVPMVQLPYWMNSHPFDRLPPSHQSRAIKISHDLDYTFGLLEDKGTFHERQAYLRSIDRLHQYLSKVLQQLFPDSSLCVYGSCLSDLSLGKSSDVDLSLHIDSAQRLLLNYRSGTVTEKHYESQMKSYVLRTFRKLLARRGEFRNLQPVAHARVPVVRGSFLKANNPFSDDGSLDFDICFLNDIAVANSSLLREYSWVDPRVRSLMMTVKRWAKDHDIAFAQHNTLSSYTWMNMVVFYLQCLGLVPNLQSSQLMNEVGFFRDMSNQWHNVNQLNTAYLSWEQARSVWQMPASMESKSVTALLYGFFDFYVSLFPGSVSAVSIKRGRDETLVKSCFRKVSLFLCIEDPFETYNSYCPHDLGSHANEPGMSKIVRCLQEAEAHLRIAMLSALDDPDHRIELKSLWPAPDRNTGSTVRNANQRHRNNRGMQQKTQFNNRTKQAPKGGNRAQVSERARQVSTKEDHKEPDLSNTTQLAPITAQTDEVNDTQSGLIFPPAIVGAMEYALPRDLSLSIDSMPAANELSTVSSDVHAEVPVFAKGSKRENVDDVDSNDQNALSHQSAVEKVLSTEQSQLTSAKVGASDSSINKEPSGQEFSMNKKDGHQGERNDKKKKHAPFWLRQKEKKKQGNPKRQAINLPKAEEPASVASDGKLLSFASETGLEGGKQPFTHADDIMNSEVAGFATTEDQGRNRAGRWKLKRGLLWWNPLPTSNQHRHKDKEANENQQVLSATQSIPQLFVLPSTNEVCSLLQHSVPIWAVDRTSTRAAQRPEEAVNLIESLIPTSHLADGLYQALLDVNRLVAPLSNHKGEGEIKEIDQTDYVQHDEKSGDTEFIKDQEHPDELMLPGERHSPIASVQSLNSLRILTPLLLDMLCHPQRMDHSLIIQSSTIKGCVEPSCWLLGQKVFDVTTIAMSDHLVQCLRDSYTCLGVCETEFNAEISTTWTRVLDEAMKGFLHRENVNSSGPAMNNGNHPKKPNKDNRKRPVRGQRNVRRAEQQRIGKGMIPKPQGQLQQQTATTPANGSVMDNWAASGFISSATTR